MISLRLLSRSELAAAQAIVTAHHYLHAPVDARCSVEGYAVHLPGAGDVGILLLGRPEATRCYRRAPGAAHDAAGWYGSVEDVATGRAEVTRWQVLNLARVWMSPDVQPGGRFHSPEFLPGRMAADGSFQSNLGTAAIAQLRRVITRDYLIRRPPCFLEEPYQLRWLLSYCDTRVHRGTLYKASGAELFSTNKEGIQTWRWPLRRLTPAADTEVRQAAEQSPRSRDHRARRAQTALALDCAR